MVDDDVLHQVHAAPVQRVGQRTVVGQRAQVRVDLLEMLRPVAVVAGEAELVVDPLVAHRRRQPERGGAQALDVVEPLAQSLEVTAVVAVDTRRVVFARPLVVVARIAVGEAIGHHEIDDLVAPVGRGNVEPQRGGLRRSPIMAL
jgi:hypothetical protein